MQSLKAGELKLFGRLNVIQWSGLKDYLSRERIERQLRRGVHPVIKSYILSGKQSLTQPAWKYVAASVLVDGVKWAALMKLAVLLAGLVSREWILSDAAPRYPLWCPAEAVNPLFTYFNAPPTKSILKRLTDAILSSSGELASILVLIFAVSAAIAPALSARARYIIAFSHFESQLQSAWSGGLKSKFDFKEEAAHGLSLVRSASVSLVLLTAASIAAIRMSSSLYALSAVLVSWQLLSVAFMGPSESLELKNINTTPSRKTLKWKLRSLL